MDKVRQFVKAQLKLFKQQLAVGIEPLLKPNERVEIDVGCKVNIIRTPRVRVGSGAAVSRSVKVERHEWKPGERLQITDEEVPVAVIDEVLRLDLKEREEELTKALKKNRNKPVNPEELHRLGFTKWNDINAFNILLRKSGLLVVLRPADFPSGGWGQESYRFFGIRPNPRHPPREI